ncbi:MAG: hypothetical protein V3U03_07470, partial [Myxococcota bacterium]
MAHAGMLDRYRKAARTLSHRVDDYGRIGRRSFSARLHAWAGRPEASLLEHAQLIRHVKRSRESMRSYRRIEELVARYPSALASYALDDQLPERLVCFVGYPGSGHSLVGSLVDAHPHAAVAHELNALEQIRCGHSFEQTLKAIRWNALFFHQLGRSQTDDDCRVPGQFQGRVTRLRVAGDKRGNGTVRLLRRHPQFLDLLAEKVPVPLRFVHVIGNPYDNIATRARRQQIGLDHAARGYFAHADTFRWLREQQGERVLDLYLDDLLARPAAELTRLLNFLRLGPPDADYLEDCASVLFEKPRRPRDDACWDR